MRGLSFGLTLASLIVLCPFRLPLVFFPIEGAAGMKITLLAARDYWRWSLYPGSSCKHLALTRIENTLTLFGAFVLFVGRCCFYCLLTIPRRDLPRMFAPFLDAITHYSLETRLGTQPDVQPDVQLDAPLDTQWTPPIHPTSLVFPIQSRPGTLSALPSSSCSNSHLSINFFSLSSLKPCSLSVSSS